MRTFNGRMIAASLLAFFTHSISILAEARPVIIHEQERFEIPEPYDGPTDVCLSGNDALVLAHTDGVEPERPVWHFLHFARQQDGTWYFVTEAAAVTWISENENNDNWTLENLACDGPIAAFAGPYPDAFVFELGASGWNVSRLSGITPSSVDVHGDTVAFGGQVQSPTSIAIVKKNAAGQWAVVSHAIGKPGFRQDSEIKGPHDVVLARDETTASGNYHTLDGGFVSNRHFFELVNGSWHLTMLPPTYGSILVNDEIGMQIGDRSVLPDEVTSFHTRDAAGAWSIRHALLSEEDQFLTDIEVQGAQATGLVGNEIVIYREEAPRRYRHAATLIASDVPSAGVGGIRERSMDGQWIAAPAASTRTVYLFHVPTNLPAAPQVLEETFEDNIAADWLPWGKTDWRIVSSGGSRAYRQLNVQGDARAILQTFEGADQAIQADVRIRSLTDPNKSFAGFMVRYTDPRNFYYLLVDHDSVQIRRMLNGVFGPIATAPFSLALGRSYRFRLEAIGERLRAFVDGRLIAEVLDGSHPQGRTALMMWKASAEYDNIVVSATPQVTLFEDPITYSTAQQSTWLTSPAGAWNAVVESDDVIFYRQSLRTGYPRAVNGLASQDQIVTAEVRPRSFNASGNGWIGLMARYVDPMNYYYVRLTGDNTIELRKRVNGVFSTLESAPMTVTPGTVYRLTIEAIGPSLRAYVNGQLRVEGQDASLTQGRYGLVTFEAAGDFDNFAVVRP